jgi:hypothetical protein
MEMARHAEGLPPQTVVKVNQRHSPAASSHHRPPPPLRLGHHQLNGPPSPLLSVAAATICKIKNAHAAGVLTRDNFLVRNDERCGRQSSKNRKSYQIKSNEKGENHFYAKE